MKKIILALFCMLSAVLNAQDDGFKSSSCLLHNKGMQSAGARVGIGTKNKIGYGLDWSLCLNSNLAVAIEIDQEKAVFGHSDFSNDFLFGGGIDWAFVHPTNWMFLNWTLGANIGHDTWSANVPKNGTVKTLCYGANTGFQMDFYPTNKLNLSLKAQQYLLFSHAENYTKPMFTFGIKYVWNN